MDEFEVEDCCIENKQSTVALASSISKNSGGVTVKYMKYAARLLHHQLIGNVV